MVPMLDEKDFGLIEAAYRSGLSTVKTARILGNRALVRSDREGLYEHVIAVHRGITGISGVEPEEILRHRLSRFGAPCANCGKELRTPNAKKCLECGHRRGR